MEEDDSNGSYADYGNDTDASDGFLTFDNEDTNNNWLDLNGVDLKKPMSKQTPSETCWKECCVPTCGRSYGTWPQIRLFKFPRNAVLCKLWLNVCNINIENFDLKRSFICDAHFNPDQLGHRSLIRYIVPTLNLPDQIEQRKLDSHSSCDNLPDPTGLVKFNDATTNKAWQNLNEEDFGAKDFIREFKMNQKIPEVRSQKNSRKCCVPNCGRSYQACTNIRIYTFPQDVDRRRAWLKACGISPEKYNSITSTFGVCDAHFLPHELLRRLRREAVPTQNVPVRLEHEDAVQKAAEVYPKKNSRKCCVPNCGRSYQTCTNIRIYTFPQDVDRRQAWLKACGISPEKYNSITSTFGVCDAHFLPHELLRRLHHKTVPTQNLPEKLEHEEAVQKAATVSPDIHLCTEIDLGPESGGDQTRDGIDKISTNDCRRSGRKCCVPTCGRSYRTTRNIRIYMFPKDVKSRRAWLKACGISPAEYDSITSSLGVCDAHFLPHELLRLRLRRGTVPSQNLPERLEAATDSPDSDIAEETHKSMTPKIKCLTDNEKTITPKIKCLTVSPKCCIASCGRILYKCPGMVIYKFPQDEETRRAWFDACGISEADYIATNQTAGVCDAHFLPGELSDELAPGIVPTQNLTGSLGTVSKDGVVCAEIDLCRESDEVRSGDRRSCSRKCVVPNCGRGYRTSRNTRIFTFPADKRRRRAWLNACGISLDEYYSFNSSIGVCDAHFLPHELLLRLRRETVPTQNLPGGLPAGSQDAALDEFSESEAEDCNFCLYSERRTDIYRHKHERIMAKLAALKKKEAESIQKLRLLQLELAFQRNPDLRQPEHRTKMKNILQNVKGMSKSAQIMFLMLMKPIQSWDEDEKQLALNLYHKAPIPFKFFKQKLKLHVPHRKTLMRWAQSDKSPVCPKKPRNHEKGPSKKRRPDGKGNTEASEVDEPIPKSSREDELVIEIPESGTTGDEDTQVCDLVYEEYEDPESEELIYESPEDVIIIYEGHEGDGI